jgi:type I restriction enzyme S subunit
MKDLLKKIGIHDESFDLMTVHQLISRGALDRPLDGNHGEIHPKSEDFVSEGVPFIMATDVNNGNVDYISCNFIAPNQADGLRKGFARNGDVLLTHKATIGRTAIVNYDKHPYVMLTPQVTYYRVKDGNVLSNRYLRHYFESELFQKTLHLWADSGSTRAYLGITAQQKLPIIVPPLDKQRKIAAVLSAYDDLIENNKLRIGLLEKIAEEIYREWFVRFRFPGHEGATFEKGIPAGWQTKRLADLARTQYGFTASSEHSGEGSKFLRITDIVPSAIDWDNVPHCTISEKEEEKYLLKEGDIVVARTGATVGYAKRINKLHPRSVFASYLVRLIPNNKTHSLYLGLSIEREPFKDFISMFMTGAAQPQANATTMSRFPVLLPPNDLLADFNKEVEPLIDQRELLLRQSAALGRIRDKLLPRLISGKLSVDNLDLQFPPSMTEEMEATRL